MHYCTNIFHVLNVTETWKISYVSYPSIYTTVQSFPDKPLVAVTSVEVTN